MMPYRVASIGFVECRDFMIKHHYARGMANTCVAAYGLFDGRHLIGALAFATSCSENVRASVFGAERKSCVTELHRLCILDVTPRNAESWFIARCLRQLLSDKPTIKATTIFADPTAGHVGTIYQASNAQFYGQSKPEWFYIDQTGRLRHRRQCGVNISKAEAIDRGWRPTLRQGKFRYLLLLPEDRWERRQLADACLLPSLPYPKQNSTVNGVSQS